MSEIDFGKIEKKWQSRWEKEKTFSVKEDSKKEKFYVLEMFPYPSGSGLHMGHAWNYTIGDIIARMKIMQGFNVLHPMGYDSFGLPAENAAIKEKKHPKDYTETSMKNFEKQQKELGLSYDWDRLIAASNSDYYKWDQWLFLKMFEKGLAYQKESAVNWCPDCNTVLANEQVQNGVCWRHEDTKVEMKQLKQWFLKITDYANELYEEIDNLKDWPEKTRAMQKNWIGKSHGLEIDFLVNEEKWPVFTTRPDTLFGVTFLVVSAQHSKLKELVTKKQEKEVSKFLEKIGTVSKKSMKEVENLDKEGVFTGSFAIHPITNEKLPIYAGNFVVADYGSGMVMAVPAHDKRDFEFAKKYGIEIRQVIEERVPGEEDLLNAPAGTISLEPTLDEAYTGKGTLYNSGDFNYMNNEEAKKKISEFLEKKKIGRKKLNFRLRDWGISRQRYWGTPIPIIHCKKCGIVPVPEKDLPVLLPEKVEFGKGNPLEKSEDWLKVKCPKCSGNARREAETMDTFVNSSWYFFRYADPKNNKRIFDEEKVKYWSPIDVYIGGAEHACMHLIFCRFYTKFLRDLGLVNFGEPIKKLFHQGMLHGEDGNKMSKSKGNVVLPETVSNEYGIDTARFFLCNLASPDKDLDWSSSGIVGSLRFIKRIFSFQENFINKKDSNELLVKLNKTIKNVTDYFENFDYRKATIELRELFDLMEKEGGSKDSFEKFLKILSPICPHVTEELFERLGNKKLISKSDWPKFEKEKIVDLKKEIDVNERIVLELKKVLEKNQNTHKKAYVYVMPFEIQKVNLAKITKEFSFEIEIFAVNDPNKFDPENKAKKAIPGKPAIYLE